MRLFLLALTAGLLMGGISCTRLSNEDHKFEAMANQFIEDLLELHPQWATGLGEHRYDHLLDDYSGAGIQKKKAFYQAYLDSLNAIDSSRLCTPNRIDYSILHNQIKSSIFRLDTLRSYEWNPRVYNVGGAIWSLLVRDFAPLKDRLQNVKERLKGIPTIIKHAKINLKNPPKVHTETAILQNEGTVSLIRDELTAFLDKVPELKDEFKPIQDSAVAALEEYGIWLEKELLPKSTGDFRLGDEKYRIKLRYTLESELSKEEILRKAEADLVATQKAMYETALPLFKQLFPDETDPEVLADKKKVMKMVLDRLADDHPTAENSVDVAKVCLKECEDFVQQHDFVTLPEEPIKVIVMPEFQRGVAVAYCDSPGPLEEKGETFYAVSPPPKDWDVERVESYFREYNNYMLRDLTVHEAMPGHYLQLAHANRLKAPTLIRAIFGSGTFIEGWATYTEQLMVEHGFGGSEVKMQQLKMRLRMIINAIIDQKIHTAGMTEKEAMDLMMNEGLQEEGEAAGKWRRACLTSTQLSTYYVGNTEVNEIRKAYEAKYGDKANLKELHDKMLSFGSPASKYVKELMGL